MRPAAGRVLGLLADVVETTHQEWRAKTKNQKGAPKTPPHR
jgi:hypothetical protein